MKLFILHDNAAWLKPITSQLEVPGLDSRATAGRLFDNIFCMLSFSLCISCALPPT